jgi:hypothetical protein
LDKFTNWIIDVLCGVEEVTNPYKDTHMCENKWIRVFDFLASDFSEFVWHRDRKDRLITVLEGTGWKFQLDNELPKNINSNDTIFVPKMIYHRLIPGTTNLVIQIEEKD